MRTNCVRQNYNIVKGAKLGEGGREGGRTGRYIIAITAQFVGCTGLH